MTNKQLAEDDNNKILEERVSPFKVGDKIYFAEEWCIPPNWLELKDVGLIKRSQVRRRDDKNINWQPASTMPIELAEHFKTVTNVGVEYCYVEGGEFADCIEIEPDKKWQWKVEVE